jgi:hypothetical protein
MTAVTCKCWSLPTSRHWKEIRLNPDTVPLSVHCNLWWCIEGGSKLKYCIISAVYGQSWPLSKGGAVSGFDCIMWHGRRTVYQSFKVLSTATLGSHSFTKHVERHISEHSNTHYVQNMECKIKKPLNNLAVLNSWVLQRYTFKKARTNSSLKGITSDHVHVLGISVTRNE